VTAICDIIQVRTLCNLAHISLSIFPLANHQALFLTERNGETFLTNSTVTRGSIPVSAVHQQVKTISLKNLTILAPFCRVHLVFLQSVTYTTAGDTYVRGTTVDDLDFAKVRQRIG
jgi:hypothetical protein